MGDELRKNQELKCAIEGCTGEGLGVARVDGRAVFVSDALPGESCRIRILKAGRSAVYVKVLERFGDSPCGSRRTVPITGAAAAATGGTSATRGSWTSSFSA